VAQGCDRLYVKVDSTMRGSVAAQLRGALDAWAASWPDAVVVLCPAFPDEGRTVAGGEVLVDGIPLHRSAAAIDPLTPVAESRLERLVPHVSGVLFVDASTDADLDAVAAGVDALGPRGVAAGSAGLAAALARRWSPGRAGTSAHVHPSARMLIGVTSLHPVTRQSVERLASTLADPDRGPAVVDVIGTGALRRDPVAVVSSFGEQVAERLAGGSYDTLVLVGGDGAAAALQRVGARAVTVHGSLAPGVPVGTIVGGAAHGLRVVTKSGGFGRPDLVLEIVDRLQSSPSIREEQP
jgi:uncharacterized protein YgbK (DUF1537 family)